MMDFNNNSGILRLNKIQQVLMVLDVKLPRLAKAIEDGILFRIEYKDCESLL